MTDPTGRGPGAAGPRSGPLSVLERIRAGKPLAPAGERCEMCGEPVSDEHSHVVNVGSRSLMCTCRACFLLFTAPGAQLAYRAVPDRYLSFPDFALSSVQWDDLQIPVGMVFLFHNSPLDHMVAFYPGPAGATESDLPLGAWDEIVAANPALSTLDSDVEAILVRAIDGDFECFLVPIDACYELVGHMRLLWRGFDGGQEVHAKLAEFFGRVRERSRPAPAQP
ncbi:MAG: DUF5947 family protein [Actinomycetota bacterium]|nr:DUF5947 family protein [Actinomycetota bacterium]